MASDPDARPAQVRDLTLTPAAGFVALQPPYNGTLHQLGRAEGQGPSAFLSVPARMKTKGVETIRRDNGAAECCRESEGVPESES